MDQGGEGVQSLQMALHCFSQSLELAPNDAFIRDWRDRIQAFLVGEGETDT
jgi:hypothetical protein